MSAIEQALRRIAEQRQQDGTAVPPMSPLEASTVESGEAFSRAWPKVLGLAAAAVLLSVGAGSAWLWWQAPGTPATMKATTATNAPAAPLAANPAPAQAPAAPVASATPQPLPAPAAQPLPVAVTAVAFTTWDWSQEPSRLWASGQHPKAARLWLEALRTQSPGTTALLLAERQTLPQAIQVHRDWAVQLPVVVLAPAASGGSGWMVLAVPIPAEIDRARDLLKAALGRAPAWGSLSHWITMLEAAASAPAPAPAPAATATAKPVPAAPPLAVAAPTAATAPTAAAAPARAPDPAPAVPPPGSSTAVAAQSSASGPSAASKAIDADFQAIERLLARGDHATARDAVNRLEQFTGQTWRTRYLAGVALSGLGRWDEASAALAAAQARNPGHLLVAVYLSVALQEKGEHAQAVRVLAQALERHPAVPELWLNQGISLQALGQGNEASQAYQRFVELSANRADLQAQRSWAQGRIQNSR